MTFQKRYEYSIFVWESW